MIVLENVSKVYEMGDHQVKALDEINLFIEKGESVAICGPSGSGKSTLLHLLGGMDRPTSGAVKFEGQNLNSLKSKDISAWRRQKLGIVFQNHELLEDFTALENVMMPLLLDGVSQVDAKARAQALLNEVGLKDRENHFPQELSGGQAQRVAMARAVVHRPSLILADEPTGNLDELHAEQVFALLCQLNRDLNATLIVVTHDPNQANCLQRRVFLENGRLKKGSET
jgi:lipoprotein-releasing system ATP-binding protein